MTLASNPAIDGGMEIMPGASIAARLIQSAKSIATACLVTLALLFAGPVGTAHADGTWSLQAAVANTYTSNKRWSKPSYLGGPTTQLKYATSTPQKPKKPKKVVKAKKKKKIGWKGGAKSFKNTAKKSVSKPVKVASLGNSLDVQPAPEAQPSLSGGAVRWVASAGCLNGQLKAVVNQVAAKFGPVTVNSTCRSKKRNRRVGGAKQSKHLTGNAVDFRVHANHKAAYAFLKSHGSVGGYKHYGGGLFHIDTGPRRTW